MSERKTPKDYEVGYKKPPKEHQFKPGDRAHPGGRPRGSTKSADPVDRVLGRTMTVTEGGKRRKVPASEALLMKTLDLAFKEDPAARRDIFKIMASNDAAKRQKGTPDSAAPGPSPFPPIIFKTYADASRELLGITIEINGDERIRTWVVELALGRMTPEELAEIDFSELVHDVEDPAILQKYQQAPDST